MGLDMSALPRLLALNRAQESQMGDEGGEVEQRGVERDEAGGRGCNEDTTNRHGENEEEACLRDQIGGGDVGGVKAIGECANTRSSRSTLKGHEGDAAVMAVLESFYRESTRHLNDLLFTELSINNTWWGVLS